MKPFALLDGPWGRRLFFAGVVAALAVTLFLRVRFVPYHCLDTGGYDENVVYGVMRILQGLPLYSDPEAPPFAVIQYTPLHLQLMAWGASLAGVGPDDVQGAYVWTRILSLLFTLLSCWALYGVCRTVGLSALTAFGVSVLFITGMPVFCYMRPDATYMLWFWLHVLTFLRAVREPQGSAAWKSMAIPALFAVAAIYTKQTGVLTLLLAGAFLLNQRRWRDLMWSALWVLVFGLAGLGLLHMEGGLDAGYKNIVLGVANGVQLGWMLSVMSSKYALVGMGWMILGTAAAVLLLRRVRTPLAIYVGLATIICLGWGILTGLKAGMNVNYFTEHYVFAAMAVGLWMASATAPWMRRFFLTYLPFIALFKTGMYFSAFEITHYFPDDPEGYATERSIAEELQPELSDSAYIFLTDRSYLELFLPDRTLLDQKDIITTSGTHLKLDHSELFRMADDGRMRYVITLRSDSAPSFEGHDLGHYVPLFDRGDHRVLVHPRYAVESR